VEVEDLLDERSEPAEGIRPAPEGRPLASFFSDPASRYDFSTLLRISGYDSNELIKRLWDEVWKGHLTNDTFLALRQGILNRFKLPGPPARTVRRARHRPGCRTDGARQKEIGYLPGTWHPLPTPELSEDLLEGEELRKDRARLLLDRYGILFRELLQRELPGLRWSAVFRALRIMELSGEVMAGLFFKGIPGLQFISQEAYRRLKRPWKDDVIFRINATDPASLCGIKLDSIRGGLPARVSTTHLVYRGTGLLALSKRNGRDLCFYVPPDDPDLPVCLESLRSLLTRPVQPLRRVIIETINDEKASESPYVRSFRTLFDVMVDYRTVTLYRKVW
jgi:ATP-dependent helicase Lhr and Lhr-like helicase